MVDKIYVKKQIKKAKDFGYPDSVILAIKNAKSEIQIDNIMHDAKNLYL